METIYTSSSCAHCEQQDQHQRETFKHLTECPQHNEMRKQMSERIDSYVKDAGGNPDTLPIWFSCPRTRNLACGLPYRRACDNLQKFDKTDGSLGYIPSELVYALRECGVPKKTADATADKIAHDVQKTTLGIWRARCQTHSKYHKMGPTKTRIRKQQKKAQRATTPDPQQNSILRYMQPRVPTLPRQLLKVPNIHLPLPGSEPADVEAALGKPVTTIVEQQKAKKQIKITKRFEQKQKDVGIRKEDILQTKQTVKKKEPPTILFPPTKKK